MSDQSSVSTTSASEAKEDALAPGQQKPEPPSKPEKQRKNGGAKSGKVITIKRINPATGHGWRFYDMTGKKFGRLTVEAFDGSRGTVLWKCKCDCGATVITRGTDLRSGKSKSCGCLKKELTSKRSVTHGKSKTRTYHTWRGMFDRCYRERSNMFQYYGALGVRVCSRWKHFEAFLEDMGECPPGLTIERKNPYGDYTPDNCCWATPIQQANNKRNSKWITANGRTMTQAMWSRETGIPAETIHYRLQHGITPEKAVSK